MLTVQGQQHSCCTGEWMCLRNKVFETEKCLTLNSATIGLNNGLSPVRHQAIIKTNADLSSIGPEEQTLAKF